MTQEYWKTKLTELDAELCQAVQSLTERPCEPKSGGDHYFIEVDYRNNTDPQHILAVWDLIEERAGSRLIELEDDPERQCLWARVAFVINDKH